MNLFCQAHKQSLTKVTRVTLVGMSTDNPLQNSFQLFLNILSKNSKLIQWSSFQQAHFFCNIPAIFLRKMLTWSKIPNSMWFSFQQVHLLVISLQYLWQFFSKKVPLPFFSTWTLHSPLKYFYLTSFGLQNNFYPLFNQSGGPKGGPWQLVEGHLPSAEDKKRVT